MIIQPQILPTTTTTSQPEMLVFPKVNGELDDKS